MHGFAGSLWIQGVFSLLVMGLHVASANASDKTKPMQIAIAKTFLSERSKSVVDIAADDFRDVMKKTTGLTGELIPKYGILEIAEKLHKKELDIGIFHGHEFAWMQKKYPDLQPLLLAVNKHQEERAYLVVPKDSPAKTFADLRGKKVDLPSGAKQYCQVFVEKYGNDKDQKGPAAFFGAIQKSATQSEALDDLCRDKVQAVVVDSVGLGFYKEVRGPVFMKNLKVLQESEPFPAAVIAHKKGALDEATLNRFRAGLLKAHTIDAGRDMMKQWKIATFERVPENYSKTLADVLKSYPPPLKMQ